MLRDREYVYAVYRELSFSRAAQKLFISQPALSLTIKKLEAELENLNDPAYLEKIAREKLGLVRPNERVFVDANKSETNTGE